MEEALVEIVIRSCETNAPASQPIEVGQRSEASTARRVVRQRAVAAAREDPSEVGRARPEP
jgi:hypothetical protein